MELVQEKSWRCSVCGYIHTGNHPPEICPICGVGASEFEEVKPQTKISETPELKNAQWRCSVCNYVHNGDKAPSTCPVCAASANMFSRLTARTEEPPPLAAVKKIVLIGAGVAGVSAAETIREVSPDTEITLLSNEAGLPYYRLNLTRFLAGEIEKESLLIHSKEWYSEKNILLHHDRALSLDLEKKKVRLSGGGDLSYDKLIITMGAHPFMPPYPGGALSGIMNLRTLIDAEEILTSSTTLDACLCIGGGVLGIETAASLAKRGVKVTLLEAHDWLMPRQLNKRAGTLLQKCLEKTGVTVKTNVRVDHFNGTERFSSATLSDGSTISASLAIITTGIRSNTYLAKQSGFDVSNGVQVDSSLRTSISDVYAAGDVAEHNGTVYGLWGAAQFQGKIAALNAMGIPTSFGGIPRSNTLKVLEQSLMSIGQIIPEDGAYSIVDGFENNEDYYYFLFHDNLLLGAILFGNTRLSATVKKVIEEKQDCSSIISPKSGVKEIIDFLS